MVIVLAKLKAKKGSEADMEATIRAMMPEVAKEEGTLLYTLHQAQNDSTQFMFFERYQDMEALGVHSSSPHFKKLMTDLAPLIEGKPEIELYTEVASCPPRD